MTALAVVLSPPLPAHRHPTGHVTSLWASVNGELRICICGSMQRLTLDVTPQIPSILFHALTDLFYLFSPPIAVTTRACRQVWLLFK